MVQEVTQVKEMVHRKRTNDPRKSRKHMRMAVFQTETKIETETDEEYIKKVQYYF